MNFRNDFIRTISILLRIISLIIAGIVVVSLAIISLYSSQIPPTILVQLTILSFILAYIPFVLPNKQDKELAELKSKAKDIQTKVSQIDPNTQQIIAQINHLEELQKALADQIQSLKDSNPTAELLEEPNEDDDPVDLFTGKDS